jgi:hypothetical protein
MNVVLVVIEVVLCSEELLKDARPVPHERVIRDLVVE